MGKRVGGNGIFPFCLIVLVVGVVVHVIDFFTRAAVSGVALSSPEASSISIGNRSTPSNRI